MNARPNPASGIVQVQFLVTEKKGFRAEVYNLEGARVRVLETSRVMYGVNTATWDGRDERGRPAPAGVYIFRTKAGKNSGTFRITLTR